jgi:hypothetical protein
MTVVMMEMMMIPMKSSSMMEKFLGDHISGDQQFATNIQKFLFYQKTEIARRRT